jgi:tetrapyrrole methylase family protein/MazG family protein
MEGQIKVVGLGPGSYASLSLQAWKLLKEEANIYLRTEKHPLVIELLRQGIKYASFDYLYEQKDSFSEVYEEIVLILLAEARNKGTIVYCVPGHPLFAEDSVRILLEKAGETGVDVQIVSGLSFLDAIVASLKIDPSEGLKLIDALKMDKLKCDPSCHNIIVQVYNRLVASEVKLELMEIYPDDFTVTVLKSAGVEGEEVRATVPLYELDRIKWIDYLTSIYLPPAPHLAKERSEFPLDPLVEVMSKLRGEGGCPWDREQDHRSLKPYLLEESYEVIETIDDGDMYKMEEELGDLLLQVVFHAQIAREEGYFDMNGVISSVVDKMIYRHPHVFGKTKVENSDEVLVNWEKLKEKERGGKKEESIFEHIPKGLPALLFAHKLQKKAAKVGFDWPNVEGAWDKVGEEIEEFARAFAKKDKEHQQEEIGDLIFALVNVARMLGLNAEIALQEANAKFVRRFRHIEKRVREAGRNLEELSLEEMDALWEEAKEKFAL